MSWGALLRDESRLKEAYRQYYKATSDAIMALRDEKYYDGEHTIHPRWTYPALRSRPGDLQDMQINDGSGSVLVTKHRDRAAGGVFVMSQLFWPIFKPDKKAYLAKTLISEINRLTNLKLITPEVEGVEAYVQFLEEDPHSLNVFDTSLAERIEAQISDLPTAANLSIQGFEKRYGQKKFSGVAPTRTDQYLTEPYLVLAAIKLGYLSKASHYYFGGDNWACPSTETIPEEIQDVLAPDGRWLGHNPFTQSISGFKLTVDSAEKSLNWNERQLKFGCSQVRSGAVRLTRTLIGMNLIPDIMTYRDFLSKVAGSTVDTIVLHEGQPFHNLLDKPEIAKQLISDTPELEHACEAVLELSTKVDMPYKLVSDIRAPIQASFTKV
jgi:hypothetical protein